MPLKVTGRHYAENLQRCDILFATMRHFGLSALFEDISIVVPGAEAALITRYAAAWSDFPIRIVVEDDFLAVFAEYTKIYQVRPWHRQQIIKLFSVRQATQPFVLVLDPDVIALRPFGIGDIIRNGRAMIQPESRSVHPDWWRASARLLDWPLDLEGEGMSVTPAILNRDICNAMCDRLEAVHNREWYRILLENYAIDWTEYTLYHTTGRCLGLIDQKHFTPAAADLHLLADYQVWVHGDLDPASFNRLFTEGQRGLFTVLQSNLRIDPAIVAALLRPHMPITLGTQPNVPLQPQNRTRELIGAAVRKLMGLSRR